MSVYNQEIADHFRIVDKIRRLLCHAEIGNIAEGCELAQKSGRIAAKRTKMAADPIGRNRWRQAF
jgi:hypothetical protein